MYSSNFLILCNQILFSGIEGLILMFPKNKAKCFNALFVTLSAHIESNNVHSVWNIANYPPTIHFIVVQFQVKNVAIFIIDKPQTTYEVESVDEVNGHLFNLIERVDSFAL